ncbi:MAG: hypothetical protein KBB70_01185 [Candidatus Pacebacteria bacterium]|jgi:hypothetical protein|nr:hypothetical protein [Candidatus Paceibacterota bacterium]
MESLHLGGDMPANDSERLADATAKQGEQASSLTKGIAQNAQEISQIRRSKEVLDNRINELKNQPEKAILCSLLLQAAIALSSKIQAMEEINKHSELSVKEIDMDDLDNDMDDEDIQSITIHEQIPKADVGQEFIDGLQKKLDETDEEISRVQFELKKDYPEELEILTKLLEKKGFDN